MRGGVLRFGAQGGADTDTLGANNVLTNTHYARVSQLYDPLVRMDDHGQPQLALAEAIAPNRTAREWTIRLRKGVVFHDGKPLTGQDVLFTFDRIIRHSLPGKHSLGTLEYCSVEGSRPSYPAVELLQPVRHASRRPDGPLVPVHRARWLRPEATGGDRAVQPG